MLSNITFKHRLIGAIFLVSLAVIIIPALFDTPRVDSLSSAESLPEAPLQAAWEELDKIEYTFSELPAAEELALAPVETPSEIEPTPEIVAVVAPQHGAGSTPNSESTHNSEKPAPAPESKLAVASIHIPGPQVEEPVVIAATEKLIVENAWAVQLGAFSKPENAQALVKRLQDKGYDAYIEEMASAKLTRVLVGIKENKQQASELLTELDKDMQLKGIVVKYNPKG
jgi:DedD protein